ncbi:MAG: sodium-dependent bicarbonate transport family permease [Hydrogenophaga sp.]|uniref:sodium-dependent bicarbonate transport family permease n=1 Tax=Hydrogenophaga sp. TaxID=1904254 RepID=UPI003D0AE766
MDVVVLFFGLGLVARLAGSELKVPPALYETLSIYLLLAIGLKGGVEISRQPLQDLLPQVAACVALSLAVPFAVVPLLRRLGFSGVDSASLAAHYGSVSVVTFAVATSHLHQKGVTYESHAALWVALMEAPALLSAIFLARRGGAGPIDWRHLSRDVLAGPSVMLLAGGLVIGAFMGEAGTAPLKPVFVDPFKGVLALFMLELGLVLGERLAEVRRYGLRLLLLGTSLPLLLAVAGALVGKSLDLSTGGVALMATLAASASYIAAPTAMRIGLPQANAGLSIAAALGVTFPFNILVGIPIYLWFAGWLA